MIPHPERLHPLLVGLWWELPDPAVRRLPPEKQVQWIAVAEEVLRLLFGGHEQLMLALSPAVFTDGDGLAQT